MDYNGEAYFKKHNIKAKTLSSKVAQPTAGTTESYESFNFLPSQRGLQTENRKGMNFDSRESKFYSEIDIGIQACNSSMNSFQREYHNWNRERQNTISKLKSLAAELHEDQLTFNRTNLLFKEMNVSSRGLKKNDDSPVDFFASLGAFVTDAIGGINSIAQACNVDNSMKTFGEIMEKDAEYAKHMYAIRSRCFSNYDNVEEIIRRYHTETFGSTLNKISKFLETEDMWLELKSASKGNNLTQVIEKVDDVLRQVARMHNAYEIGRSIGNYVENNPAVIDACEATGKVLYGILDTWGRDHKSISDQADGRHYQNRSRAIANKFSADVNRALISRENSEIRRLREMLADEDEPQAKLEVKIKEAIEDLEEEMKTMERLYLSSLRIDGQL